MSFEEKISGLATKDDLITLFDRIQTELYEQIRAELRIEFDEKLKERDDSIVTLQDRIKTLELKVSDPDLVTNNICDSTDGEEKWESVPDDEKKKGGLLLIGDSKIQDVESGRLMNNTDDTKKVCMRGKRTQDVREQLKEEQRTTSYDNIVIHVGTCNIPSEEPLKVATDIASLLKTTKVNNPETNVFFSAILPKFDSSYNPGINIINKRLFDLQKSLGFTFIPHSRFCQYGNFNLGYYRNSEVRKRVPVHLSTSGTIAFASDIKHYLKLKRKPTQ